MIGPVLVRRACALALVVNMLSWLVCAARADELSSAVYVRADDDDTTIVSPRARAEKQIGPALRVDATYSADIWTSASIDIRASASVRPVTEQRDELSFGLGQAVEDVSARVGYRFSTEPDYVSHGVSLGATVDLAGKAARLDASIKLYLDDVGRAADPDFERGLNVVDGMLSFTQVFDPMTFAQLTYQLAQLNGYQASPYRFVGIGTTKYGCIGATLCLPETIPDQRTRHALALRARRALFDALSIGAAYRFYLDSWSLLSHTVEADLGLNVGPSSLLRARYRYYWQSAADFYQSRYVAVPDDGYVSRDRELSEFDYHQVGLELEHRVPLNDGDGSLSASLIASGTIYEYDDFLGLDKVLALEVTAALLLEL